AAFSYKPGPGGRLYGAYLALFNAMIATGFLINLYGEFIVPVGNVEPVTSGLIARSLSDGFGSVLLIATIGVGIATIFGMFVRDRSDDTQTWQAPASNLYQQQPVDTRPYRVEDDDAAGEQSATYGPVRILEAQSWQE